MLFPYRRVTAALVFCSWLHLLPTACAADVPLTLRQAIALTLEQNPSLSAYSHEIRALSARVVQAGLRPNPELSFDSENFNPGPLGSLGWSRFLESTLQVSQLVELGDKRKLRIQAARADQEVAAHQLLEHQGELVLQVTHAFLAVIAAQERSSNRQTLLDLAEKTREAVAFRVAAGTVSPIEEVRSDAQLGLARLEREKARLEETRARDTLAAFWNGSSAVYGRVSAAFRIPSEFLARSRQTVAENPALAVSGAQIESSRAAAGLEQAYRLPDLTVGGGLRYLSEPGGAGLAASLSIPLPFRDRREGAIAEARIRAEKAVAEQRALEASLSAQLTRARTTFQIALLEADSLTQTILPQARQAYERLEEGYRFGKFDYLSVLDAERTYFELEGRRIEAVETGLSAAADIDWLTGGLADPGTSALVGSLEEIPHVQ